MTRPLCAAVLAGLALFAGIPARAHEEFRVAGTIARLEPEGIAVKTTGGRIVAVRFGAPTRFWRGDDRAPTIELKMGEPVDIRAYGDSEEDLLALDVTLLPANAPAASSRP